MKNILLILPRLGCFWCVLWAYTMAAVSMVKPDFALVGILATLVIAVGGIFIAVEEIRENHNGMFTRGLS